MAKSIYGRPLPSQVYEESAKPYQYTRLTPALRRKIEKLAKDGMNDSDIARQCLVTRETAHKYATPARVPPEPAEVLTLKELRALKVLAQQVVMLGCPICRVMVATLESVVTARCPHCRKTYTVPSGAQRAVPV